MRYFFLLLFLISGCYAADLPLNQLHLPPGFKINIFAQVPGARSLALGKNGTVFVGTMGAGKVYAIYPSEDNKRAGKIFTIASDLNMPNGVAFHQGDLYVVESNRVLRYVDIENKLQNPVVISTALPQHQREHGWRFADFGPDGKLYIAIGVPCNVCQLSDKRYGTIARMNSDGSEFEIFASGIRNSVGFDWHPVTKQLWFTENGRDWMGDDLPPDKINVAPNAGLNFGFPYIDGTNLVNSDYTKPNSQTFTLPTYELPAHVAPLGMSFYTGNMFPSEYKNQIFVAEHGSWNRSKKIGYQVLIVKLDGNKVVSVKPFITGWLQNEKVWGRPVDMLVMRDGSLLISDDHAGIVYRVTYQKN